MAGGTYTPPKLPPERQAFLEWLTTPKEVREEQGLPTSELKFAELLGVSPRTLRDWKANGIFRRHWERRVDKLYAGPEHIGEVMHMLYRKATREQDVRAATEYLKRVEKLVPPKPVDDEDLDVSEIDDEALQRLVEAEA